MNKKSIKKIEIAFDLAYLTAALSLGVILLTGARAPARLVYGVMALALAAGDSFHLIPRVASAADGDFEKRRRALGFGKLAASLGMTVFYALLWHVGLLLFPVKNAPAWTALLYALAAARAALCLHPNNAWGSAAQPAAWGVYRNIPFALMGALVFVLFFLNRNAVPGAMRLMWLAILLSFAFYLPVVLFAGRRPWLGALMLPKSCAYVWILAMGLSLG